MKKCPRTLDKPLLLFGLEVEDIGLLALVAGIIALFSDPLFPGVLFFGGWALLFLLKRDKPTGYILHLLYKMGMPLRGLIPPVKKVKRYCVFSKEKD